MATDIRHPAQLDIDPAPTPSPDIANFVWTVRVPAWAYLRAMANLFWSAVHHPLSETTIDLSTGRVLYRN